MNIRRGVAFFFFLAAMAWAQAPTPDPIVGNPHAAVHVVMYQDLECPKCAAFHKALVTSIMPTYAARVEFEFRDFHINGHAWSYNAAVLARYLDTRNPKLGMDWRDYCFSHQTEIYPGNLMDTAAAFCAPYGIKRADLEGAFAHTELFAELQRDQDLGTKDHLTGTPFILVNGVVLPDTEAHPSTVADMVSLINAALAHGK